MTINSKATHWTMHYRMQSPLITVFLICVPLCLAIHSQLNYDKLSFCIEESEFSIVSTITQSLIDESISHGFSIQSAAISQFPKSIKIHKMIFKSIVKAQDCKSKYLLVLGQEKHKSRNILSEASDFVGSIIGSTFGKL